MAEERSGVAACVECVALEKAFELVSAAYPQVTSMNSEHMGGIRWNGVDTKDAEAVKKRLQEMADLMGDLKNRMLK